MKVTRSQQGAVSILSIDGALVDKDLGVLDAEMDECLSTGNVRIVLELRQVPFIDSAGLEKIESIVTGMGRRHGELRICSLNEVCRDIFIATRLDSLVQIYEDRDAAAASLL